ncbi:MAG: methyltransferase domain-containing protein [Patescibacteria group bacterium]
MPANFESLKTSSLQKVKTVYSFWGRRAWLYAAQDYFTFLGRPKFIRRRAVERLELAKGAKVLEVACGTGRNFSFLIDSIGSGGTLVGFDYSREMLAAAEELCKKSDWQNVKLIQGDAAELGVPEDNFDGVLSVLGISAIPDWEKALERCREVLRPGGRLVVCDARPFPNALRFFNPLIKLIYRRFAAWDPEKDIPRKMKELFGNVEVEEFNLGTFFVAVAEK